MRSLNCVALRPAIDVVPLVRPFVNAAALDANVMSGLFAAPAAPGWMWASVGLATFDVTSHVSVLLAVSTVMKYAPTALLGVGFGASFAPRISPANVTNWPEIGVRSPRISPPGFVVVCTFM